MTKVDGNKKAITITKRNRDMLAGKFGFSHLSKDELEAEFPLGHILVTDFGVEEYFDTVYPKEKFDSLFDVQGDIENGFVAAYLKDNNYNDG